MNNSIYIGYASSLSNSYAMDVVADNIANINTVGYKGSNAEFATLFSTMLSTTGSQNPTVNNYSYGTRINSTSLDLTQGSFQESEGIFHLAITDEGWFGVSSTNIYDSRQVAFTRDGTFSQDADGYLVSTSGNYLLGSDYGMITQDADGNYVIDPTATPQAVNSVTGNQTSLFVPQFLTYPASATTEATLQRNLLSEGTTQVAYATPDASFTALLDGSGNGIRAEAGQDLIFSAGTQESYFDNGRIAFDITTIDDSTGLDNSATFVLNGETVTASWNEGDDAATIAQVIQDAIDGEGIADTVVTRNGSTLTISSSDSLTITGSTSSIIPDMTAQRLGYADSTSAGSFTSLDDLAARMQAALDSVYGDNTALVYVDGNGQLNVLAKENDLSIAFAEASDTNTTLLDNLTALNGEIIRETGRTSQNFFAASSTSIQKIIDADGNERLLYVTMTQQQPQTVDSNAIWEADVSVVSETTATDATDASELGSDYQRVGLSEGQDLWFSVGNGDVQKTSIGYDYVLTAPQDIPDGSEETVSFDVNGTAVSITIPDGTSAFDAAGLIASALKNAGINADQNDETVLIHADVDTPTLAVTNGSSTIENYTIASHIFSYAQYGTGEDNSFDTLGSLTDMINTAASEAGYSLSASVTDGKLSVSNTGSEDVSFRIYTGLDSNTDFIALLTPTYDPIAAGDTVNSTTLSSLETLSETTQTLTFDSQGEMADGTVITVANGDDELSVDLSGLTNFETTVYDEFFTENGQESGDLDYYNVNTDGQIIAYFTNGANTAVSEINLYHFQNDQGLTAIGSNMYTVSANSGDPIFYLDENGEVFNGSSILANRLENSNVSTASALTEMIVLQRAFEGAAKIITTSDELLQNALNMKS